ncbi:uncharacterized protein A4U43_C05F12550 [Asparagus officinalis]|uniref:Uncharacterized protein n=1 Tax=Asparagus officinalis TaxID=4686 RepID=A0A5P1ERD2_ASPOF|nr:uncharacterized protein LOC109843768 [Asparagus officinalis]ONK68506.1 uncharacterized protein A4U43_C05F12550 [Asparagus officinalis]
MPMERSQPSIVVAIECIAPSGAAILSQTGDDRSRRYKIGSSPAIRSPFKGGRSGINKILHAAFKRGDTSIRVRVRRGPVGPQVRAHEHRIVELQACIVPNESAGRKQYVLRSIHDPNYAVGLVEKMESECIALQGSRSSRVVRALSKAHLQDGYVSYPWEKKMKESLPIPNSSSFLSMLILPMASDPSSYSYNSLEDTLARANSWLISAQASGVPIMFMNVQTEALLSKISGETATSTVYTGSLSDLSNLANASLYGFEDYHGVDIGVVRGVRLWYTPAAGELAIEIKLQEGDNKLGFAVSRTEEGFIYISSVIDEDDRGAASIRSGLRYLYKEAERASKLLVISRVSNEKVLPWMVSSSGAIRCYDTVSLSHKLSLHRHALQPILIHVLMWEKPLASLSRGIEQSTDAPRPLPLPQPPIQLSQNLARDDASEAALHRDTAGDISFRFHDFSFPNSWV